MKKSLLYFALFSIPFIGFSQNQYNQGFDVTTAQLATAGWVQTNQSAPLGASTWSIPSTTPVSTDAFGGVNRAGHMGGANSFILVNFNSTTGAGIISNWLITPNITVQNGDVVSFWTRKGTDGTTDYPDRLELRMSTDAVTVVPSGGSSGLGSFSTLALTVNPNLLAGFVYSKTWTQYSYTVTGLSAATPVKFAFRYFITNGGPSGANSDIIGIDTFSVDRTLSTNDFFKNNLVVYPNPVNDILNISNNNNVVMNTTVITDLNGRVVKGVNLNGVSSAQINISDLTTGIYLMKITTDQGVGTTKIVKN